MLRTMHLEFLSEALDERYRQGSALQNWTTQGLFCSGRQWRRGNSSGDNREILGAKSALENVFYHCAFFCPHSHLRLSSSVICLFTLLSHFCLYPSAIDEPFHRQKDLLKISPMSLGILQVLALIPYVFTILLYFHRHSALYHLTRRCPHDYSHVITGIAHLLSKAPSLASVELKIPYQRRPD